LEQRWILTWDIDGLTTSEAVNKIDAHQYDVGYELSFRSEGDVQ